MWKSYGNIWSRFFGGTPKKNTSTPCHAIRSPNFKSQGAVGSGGGMMSVMVLRWNFVVDVFLLVRKPCENPWKNPWGNSKIVIFTMIFFGLGLFFCGQVNENDIKLFVCRWIPISALAKTLDFHPIPWCLSRCSSLPKKTNRERPKLEPQVSRPCRQFVVLGLILTSRGA